MQTIKRTAFVLYALLMLNILSCKQEQNTRIVKGKKPIYKTYVEAYSVEFLNATTLKNPGKIYIYGNKIFVVEQLQGIHIINNANPSAPVIEKFIKLFGVKDIAIKNNILYADNITDFVAINIFDVQNMKVEKRIKNVYSINDQLYPEEDCWFECVDTTKGVVVGWIDADLENPRCSRGLSRWN